MIALAGMKQYSHGKIPLLMKKIKLIAASFALAFLIQNKASCFETTFIADPKTGKKVEVINNQVIVKFRSGVSGARRAALRFSAGAQASKEIPELNAETLQV